MIAAASDFVGKFEIPNRTLQPTIQKIDECITEFEPKFLNMLLGAALTTYFYEGLGDAVVSPGSNSGVIVNQEVVPFNNVTSLDYTMTPDRIKRFGIDNPKSLNFKTIVGGKEYNPDITYSNTGVNLSFAVDNDNTQAVSGEVYVSGINPVAGVIGTVVSSSPIDEKWLLLRAEVLPALIRYIYFHYRRENVSTFTSAGETVITKSSTENTVVISPKDKLVRVWNEMVDLNLSFVKEYWNVNFGLYHYYQHGYAKEIFVKINPIF